MLYVDDVRRRSKPLPELPPSENDRSSPERVELHISVPQNVTQHSAHRARNVHTYLQNTRTPTPIIDKTLNTARLSHDEVLKEESSTHHTEQPVETTDKVGLLRSSTNIDNSSPPAMGDIKPSLIHRITSKLHIPIPATTSSSQPITSAARPSEVKHSSWLPRSPRPTPTLPNSFVSRENREAALRERGLRPPRRDFSEQEREADERLVPVPLPVSDKNESGPSAASKIKEEWLIMNRSSFPSTQ